MIETLELGELWPSPLAERELIAFDRALSDRLAGSLEGSEGPGLREAVLALKRRIKETWDANDLPAFVGAALALHGAGALNPDYLRRLAWALMTQARFAEAASLFAQVHAEDHGRWFDEGRALAGAGRLTAATAAAMLCVQRLEAPGDPDVAAEAKAINRRPSPLDRACGWLAAYEQIGRRLREHAPNTAAEALAAFQRRRAQLLAEAIAAASEGGAPSDWPTIRRRATACLLLGLADRAADALSRAADLRTPLDDLAEAAPLFRAAAAFTGPERQLGLLAALVPLCPPGPQRRFAELAHALLINDAPGTRLIESDCPSSALSGMIGAILAGAGRWDHAISLFGVLAQGKRREAPRGELAACQSAETTRRLGFRTVARPGPRRLFDLFPYNGELELLKIKLHEMSPWVDRFVIVESAMTFSGRPKPLRFAQDAGALEPFMAKISHVAIERFPDHLTSAWAREFYQRDQALAALQGVCAPDDLVLLTDVDEVLDRRAVADFHGEGASVTMRFHRYFLNYRLAAAQTDTSSLWRAKLLERWSPSFARNLLGTRLLTRRIRDAGWHFSSVGELADITHKLSSYAHQENDRSDSEAHYGALLQRLRAGELEPGWETCGLGALPAYVQANQDGLAPLLL